MNATTVLGYTADADVWCSPCATALYGDPDTALDGEGNPVYPIFTCSEFDYEPHCRACGALIDCVVIHSEKEHRNMDTTRQPTCEERIDGYLRSRTQEVKDALEGRGETDFWEYGLGFDYVAPGTFNDQPRGYFRYQLSWGGPSEEVRYYVDEQFKPYRVEFWFLDWFDGAHRDLQSDYGIWLDVFHAYQDSGTVAREFTKSAWD